ncbi:MAG: rhodanese-like domain-containing protein [Pseudomonadota bacterium]
MSGAGGERPRPVRLSPAEARALVDGGRTLVVDTRSPGEFAEEALPGAVNAPWPRIKRPLGVVERTTPVAVYCDTGARARKTAEVMVAMGFTRIYLIGAMRRYYQDE